MGRPMHTFCVALLLGAVALAGCASEAPRGRPEARLFDALLTASEMHPVTLDVHYVARVPPRAHSASTLASTLEDLNGAGSFRLGLHSVLTVGNESSRRHWTFDETIRLQVAVEALGCRAQLRCIHFVFLNGGMDESPPLGSTIGRTAFIFPDQMDRFEIASANNGAVALAGPNLGAAEVERHVVVHELGHMLGLVDRGLPMLTHRLPSPEDDPCQCHSSERESPMYHHADIMRNATLDVLVGGNHFPYEFSALDLQDLHAYRDFLKG